MRQERRSVAGSRPIAVQLASIAILRGFRPGEAEAVVAALIDSGFELIEVPLIRPSPSPRSSVSAGASARIA